MIKAFPIFWGIVSIALLVCTIWLASDLFWLKKPMETELVPMIEVLGLALLKMTFVALVFFWSMRAFSEGFRLLAQHEMAELAQKTRAELAQQVTTVPQSDPLKELEALIKKVKTQSEQITKLKEQLREIELDADAQSGRVH